jgi:hypothetical protein
MAIHNEPGKENKVAFVFSCPGRYEKEAGHPAAKTTGVNLNKLLIKVSNLLARDDLTRKNITITNAWDRVEYKALTKRSEATDEEIQTQDNIGRLTRELAHVTELIVFCGTKAKLASESIAQSNYLTNKPLFLFLEHLGTRGLLSITKDLNGNRIKSASDQILEGRKDSKRKIQFENTTKRIEVVANDLVKQLCILQNR